MSSQSTNITTSHLPLLNKVALITGSSKGIGAATATHLSSLGANVIINYSSPSSLSIAQSLIASLPGGAERAIAIQADVSNVKEIERLVEESVKRWGRLDIVVANAGVMPLVELEGLTEEVYERVFALNVKGPLFLAQKAAKYLPTTETGGGGRIIFFSTTQCAASSVTPPYLTYVASKGAIEQMTRVLSKDLARKGITVNCVAPGPTATDLFLEGKSEQVINMIKGLNPQGRLGTVQDIADVVGYLAGGTGWVTGQVIRVNGGMT